MYRTRLFSKYPLDGLLSSQKQALIATVKEMSEEQISERTVEEWIDHFIEKYKIEIPVLLAEEKNISQSRKEANFSNSIENFHRSGIIPPITKGTLFEFTVPCQGDMNLFDFFPGAGPVEKPIGKISENSLIFDDAIPESQKDPQTIASETKENLKKQIELTQKILRNMTNSAQDYNNSLKTEIASLLQKRIGKFEKDKEIESSLGFQLKKNPNLLESYSYPLKKKELKREIKPKQIADKNDPFLWIRDYEEILKICSNMALVFERSPHAFKKTDEETIRFHFLVQLNAIYEGNASAETFNFEGKTDISIKDNGKNIFIAECKFWTGPQGFKETIDQIFRYLSWRDTKAAIFIFNRNRDLTNVLNKIDETSKNHPYFKSKVDDYKSETGFR